MKKLLLVLLLAASLYAENILLLSGLAWHSEKTNYIGREYDVVIEGIGYQYREDGNSVSVMLLNDSNSELLPTATIGKVYEVNRNIGIGAEVGLTLRKKFHEDGDYRTISPVLFPKIEISSGKYIMNIMYFYGIDSNDVSTPHVIYVNFGIKL